MNDKTEVWQAIPCKGCGFEIVIAPGQEAWCWQCNPRRLPTMDQAKRDPVQVRYDILVPSFIKMMARIASYGASKYGDLNWHKSRLGADASPINHIYKHLNSYTSNESYDHPEIGTDKSIHLAAIAFNAMMEFWYEENSK